MNRLQLIFATFAVFAGILCSAQNDSVSTDPDNTLSLSLQVGQPVRIPNAEFPDEQIFPFSSTGDLVQYGWSAGATARYHTSSTFFYHLRVGYGSKYRNQYDSITQPAVIISD